MDSKILPKPFTVLGEGGPTLANPQEYLTRSQAKVCERDGYYWNPVKPYDSFTYHRVNLL